MFYVGGVLPFNAKRGRNILRVSTFWRHHPESDRGLRLCRPLPYRLAMVPHIGAKCFGGNNRARTCDPLLVRQMLSQLSYAPEQRFTIISNSRAKINLFYTI